MSDAFPIFDSQTWPKDPTMPATAPDGYTTPVIPPQAAYEPPMTPAQVETRRGQFYELLLQQIVAAVTGFFTPASGSATNQLTNWAVNIPLIGPLVGAITGVVGGGISAISNFFGNLGGFLSFDLNTDSGSFNPLGAVVEFIDNILNPSDGLFSGGLIPGLDGSKLVSGQIATSITGINMVASALGLPGTPGIPPEGPTTIQDAAAIAAYNSSVLASQQAALASVQAWIAGEASRDGSISGLNRNLIIPNTAHDGDALASNNFSSTGPASGDLCVRGTRPFIGIKAANGPGTYHAILAFSYTIDSQCLEVQIVTQGVYSGVATVLYTHCNSGHAEGAYCAIANSGIQIGSYTRTGGDYTYTPFTNGTWNGYVPDGSRIKFFNDDDLYQVVMNGVPRGADPAILAVTDNTVARNSSHRRATVSMTRAYASEGFDGYPPGYYDSYRIGSINMSDRTAPAQVGSGAKMSKTNTNTFTTYTTQPVSNYFDRLDACTPDIEADLALSKFTVSVTGWYKIGIRYYVNQDKLGAYGGSSFTIVLFKNGDMYEMGASFTTGYDNTTQSTKWPTGFQSQHTVYLQSGETVQAGYQSFIQQDAFLKGEATGLQNYFSIAMGTNASSLR